MNLSVITIAFTCFIFYITSDMVYGQPTKNGERVRRSFAPNAPVPTPRKKGNVGVDIHRERGVGTVVRGQVEGNIYSSPNGNTRVDAHGHWSRVYDGPARGQRDYGGGISISHRW